MVCKLHYTADPRKRTEEWRRQASANMHPRAWRREYEIDWASPAGEPVIPEYTEDLHCRAFEWDRSLRMLRFWDFGFVSPVVLFAQLTHYGQLRIRRELCPFNTPLDQLLQGVEAVGLELGGYDTLLEKDTAWDVGGADPPTIAFDAGDPAAKNHTDLGCSAEVLGEKGIILHTTRPGTELSYAGLRARFLRNVMEPGVGVVPACIVHPECPNLRAALAGAFHLDPKPPHKPVKTHPEGDVVDALRYGEDNIRELTGKGNDRLRQMALGEVLTFRAIDGPAAGDTWADRQREKWQSLIEGL